VGPGNAQAAPAAGRAQLPTPAPSAPGNGVERTPVALEPAASRAPRGARREETMREQPQTPTAGPEASGPPPPAAGLPTVPLFPEEPVVHVTIGRIDVRAVQPPPAPKRPPAPERPRRSLDDFLAAGP
jgi:hypothetical protein